MRIVEPEETNVTRKYLGKHFPAAMDTHAIEELLNAAFSMLSMPRPALNL
jgi:hypothetical protein